MTKVIKQIDDITRSVHAENSPEILEALSSQQIRLKLTEQEISLLNRLIHKELLELNEYAQSPNRDTLIDLYKGILAKFERTTKQ